MNGVPPLEFAGVSHWAALAALLAAGACILELGQSYRNRQKPHYLLAGAACLFSLVPDLAAMLADEPERTGHGCSPCISAPSCRWCAP